MNASRLIVIAHMIIWIMSPLPVLASASPWTMHANVNEVTVDRWVVAAVESANAEKSNDLAAETFNMFIKSHVNLDAHNDGDHHAHNSLDSCCELGGLVCHAGLMPANTLCLGEQFHNWDAVADTSLSGIALPVLFLPPRHTV
ncbi:hypothetical protein [Kordiimonas sp.]|uniref:hypothetical protein n=2 Tax=Kordiimonas sp. TaxID=1970157 RepID=UPI003A918B9A